MKNQKGVTFVGMVFIAGMIIFAAIIGIKLIPAYIEYAGIVNHLRDIARSPEARGTSWRSTTTRPEATRAVAQAFGFRGLTTKVHDRIAAAIGQVQPPG